MAVLATAIMVLFLAWPSGPSYEGQSISKWFYRGGKSDSTPDPDKDKEAFRAMGREAVPFLISRLEAAPSSKVKSWIASVSSTASEVYRQRKESWQYRAAYLLGEIGPAAKSAETNLLGAVAHGNWVLRGEATVALMKIREQPPDALIEKLRDTNDDKSWTENAIMVGSFGSRAESAVPILLRALQHTNNIIQAHALIVLGMIGRQPDQCLAAILPFLHSPSVSDRQKAMGALRSFGTNALPAKTAIHMALSDSDPWVRHEAELAMKQLQAAGRPNDKPERAEPTGAANGSQPIRSATNQTPAAPGSGR